MDKMTRLRASFRSSTRRKKKKKEEDVMEDEDGMDVAYQEIELELRPNERYRPTDLRIHFSVPEAGIEVLSEAPSPWEPSMKSSLNGASVILRRKKPKSLAKTRISLKDFALNPPMRLKLRPLSRKILSATLNLSYMKPPAKDTFLISNAPLESLSLAEEDLSSEVSPKSMDVTSITDHPSLENIPDIPYKESPSKKTESPKVIPFEHKGDSETKSSSSLGESESRESTSSRCRSPPATLQPLESPSRNLSSATTMNNSMYRSFSHTKSTATLKSIDSSPNSLPLIAAKTEPSSLQQSSSISIEPPKAPSVSKEKKADFIPLFPNSTDDEDRSDLVVIPDSLLIVPNNQRDLVPSPTRFDDDELLEWAKFRLSHSDRIKITNLTSSWRNGSGES
ncbi:unnamed protein product [Lepeophtheirus salmonis]|uniref:(salmon louse) hypothetical protein n=1 Tax=Lepeophtheirus salmonis TaxID=72036 RepID=A0A7R8H1L7_LEPSM|nr:unnamed protein product [Lepeophtheirus salmonis]CAF2809526.1 unnamed protein product [Lepeophtheirus salmonis]